MASAEQVVWTGRCLRCLKCDLQIEVRDGNMERAVSLHMEAHRNLDSTTRRENDMAPPASSPSKVSNSVYRCPVCEENVEIKYNDVNLSLKLHARKHKVSTEKSIDKSSNCSGRIKNSIVKNNEELQTAPDNLSNSSSDKSKPSFKKNNEVPYPHISSTSESSILDDTFNALPSDLKAHRGFMQRNSDGKTTCNVCNLTIDNTSCISEHLKTKAHEDNAITYLKNFVTNDRLCDLDFVSFYGSNLCCNLCKSRIDLSSKNPHETIVNILNHNACKSHVNNKSGAVNKSSDVSLLLQSLSQINPTVINEYKQYVSVEMKPQISCNLCNVEMAYDKDLNNLFMNLNKHFTSAHHAKFAESSTILKLFKNLNVPTEGNHNLSLRGGNIHCDLCACYVQADLKKLEDHVKIGTSKQYEKTTSNEVPFYKQLDEALAIDKTTTQNPATVNKEELNMQSLLKSMPAQFRNVDYIVQNEESQLCCLLCNCLIPSTHFNLEGHLLGSRHKKNVEAKQGEKVIEKISVASSALEGQVSNIIDKFFNTLLKNDAVMAGHESVIVRLKDKKHFMCDLCSTLIESSQDLNNFRANLYAHVQSEMHKNLFSKRNQSNSTSNIHKGISVQALFEALPLTFAPDRQFIRAIRDGNEIFCMACNVKAPVVCLQDHLLGCSHADNVKKQFSGLVQKYATMSMDSDSSQDRMVLELLRFDKVIKPNSKYIVKRGEDYCCTLCHTAIKKSNDTKVLKENFVNHFTAQKHKNLLDQLVINLLGELFHSNPIIRAEKAFLKVRDKTVHCTLCTVSIMSHIEKGPFEKNLVSHLTGGKHQAKKKPEPIKNPEKQPVRTIQPIKPRLPDLSLNPFMSGIHTPGDQSNYVRPFPPHLMPPQPVQPFMSHPPLVPLFNQANNFGNPGENLVADLFKKLPPSLHGEIKFIESNQLIDGYVACNLCNCTINPYYLKQHLSEAEHLKKKKAFENQTSPFKRYGKGTNF